MPDARSRAWAVTNFAMLAMFLLSIAVQVNDPDPQVWMLVYGAAALACALDLMGRPTVAFPGLLAVTTGAWAMTLAPAVVGHVPFLSMFGAWEMKNEGIEVSREMYGLLIITAWSSILAIVHARRLHAR